MPRDQRIQYPGAWHHVMNRGASRQDIFLSRSDRRLFLSLLERTVKRHGVEVHAYCLMDNHYHLLIRTPEANLDKAVHHLAHNYVRQFNRRHGRDGPLFRGRFHSINVEEETYLSAVSRYIHRNPMDLGHLDLAKYEWSSYAAMIGTRKAPTWLTRTDTLDLFGTKPAYARFVEHSLHSHYEQVMTSPVLPSVIGSEDFIAEHSAEAA